ncbi:tail terminator [Gordonia phage GiKK]|nr:tail terminator [Gordonia phage GiKK]UVK63907.1 tail terminator [Gordonia phage Button]WKW84806.1 tail terminator [Gordonia phage Jamzy]
MFGIDRDVLPNPDGLKTLISKLAYLNSGLSVSEDAPRVRPEKYCQIAHLGGSEDTSGAFITVSFSILCYATSTGDARRMSDDLLAQIKSSQFSVWDGVQIRAWTTESLPHPFPDPAVSDRRRWQFVGSLGFSHV